MGGQNELSLAIGINKKYHVVPVLRYNHAAKLHRHLNKIDPDDTELAIMSSKSYFKI